MIKSTRLIIDMYIAIYLTLSRMKYPNSFWNNHQTEGYIHLYEQVYFSAPNQLPKLINHLMIFSETNLHYG